MGGFFSTPKPPPKEVPRTQQYSTYQTINKNNDSFNWNLNQHYTSQPRTSQHYTWQPRIRTTDTIRPAQQVVPSSYRTTRIVNPLTPASLHQSLARNWVHTENVCTLSDVSFGSSDYNEVSRTFKQTTQKHFKVIEIKRVQNKYLLGCYTLKKEEMQSRHNVKEIYVFHGTVESNINSICHNNFNWRLNKQHKFGQGVSFSHISNYASHYSEKNTHVRKMFLVRMLVQNITEGKEGMIIPPIMHYGSNIRYDTTQKSNGQVYVKFSDNEFYPEYIIYYTGEAIKKYNKSKPSNRRQYNYEYDF